MMAEKATAPVRHLFAGNNTPQGFFSYYENLWPAKPRRLFILKGGPGTGKSTLMRRIGEKLNGRGLVVEYCHCSSDPDSLDGVVFPELGIALVDGTAPHVIDPRLPGAADEIINLGGYWDEAQLAASRNEIARLTQEISTLYPRAYRYLSAAFLMRQEQAQINERAMNHAYARQALAAASKHLEAGLPTSGQVNKQVAGVVEAQEGGIRRLFATAITPQGSRSFLHNLFGDLPRLVVLRGSPGTGKSTLVARLADCFTARGYDCELYHDALRPDRPEHLLIPALPAGLVTGAPAHSFTPRPGDLVIDLDDGLDRQLVQAQAGDLETARRFEEAMLAQAVATLKQAKQLHDELESYYIYSMNFPALGRLQSEIEARILALSALGPQEVRPGQAKQ